jgi:hypothetical protein
MSITEVLREWLRTQRLREQANDSLVRLLGWSQPAKPYYEIASEQRTASNSRGAQAEMQSS